MELTATKEQLLPPLLRALAATDGRSLPILGHLLLEAEDDRLRVIGCDLQVQSIAHTEVCGRAVGRVAVPGRKLCDIVRMLPDQAQVRLVQAGDSLNVQSGRGRYKLVTLPGDAFPEFERSAPECEAEIPAEVLLGALYRTRFAAASNDVRFYLNGVMLRLADGTLETTASDGHRLALSRSPVGYEGNQKAVIVPIRSVDEMIRLLKTVSGPVKVLLAESSIQIEAGAVCFASKLIEGRYPDAQRVIPNATDFQFSADTRALADAVRRAAILSNSEYHGCRIEFGPDSLTVCASNTESEEATEEIGIEDLEGEPRTLAFNAHYLINALAIAEDGRVNLAIGANGGALLTKQSTVPDDVDWLTVIMPMRL